MSIGCLSPKPRKPRQRKILNVCTCVAGVTVGDCGSMTTSWSRLPPVTDCSRVVAIPVVVCVAAVAVAENVFVRHSFRISQVTIVSPCMVIYQLTKDIRYDIRCVFVMRHCGPRGQVARHISMEDSFARPTLSKVGSMTGAEGR